jgi:hypothetical protein
LWYAHESLEFLEQESHVIWTPLEVCAGQEWGKKSSTREVTNLLVPVRHAATHVAYSATRVERHFMLLGGAAGYAADYAIINEEINVQSVDINYIQRMLSNDGVLLHYPKDHCDH